MLRIPPLTVPQQPLRAAAPRLLAAAALAYALFSGWGIPAQRTVLMLGVVLALSGVFSGGDDGGSNGGRVTLAAGARKYDVDTGKGQQFWSGMVTLG